MKKTFEHKFEIGDKVKHITNNAPAGFILDYTYTASSNYIRYQATFGFDHDKWYDEIELIKIT